MPQGMPTAYTEESLHIVAMKFPNTGKPSFLQSSYPAKTWNMMILRAKLHPEIGGGPQFIMDDSEEGQAIIMGTDPADLTLESLVGMDGDVLLELAGRYGVKNVTAKTKKPAVAFKILSAIAEGVKPSPANATTTAGSGV